MCYLHKDSMQYNEHSNTSDLLYKYHLASKEYSPVNLKLVLPGRKLDLNTLYISKKLSSRNQLLSNRKEELIKYRNKYKNLLNMAEDSQDKCQFSEKNVINYFKYIFSKLPIFLRFFCKGKIAFIEKTRKQIPNYFIVDMNRKNYFNQSKIEDCHTIIRVSPGVLNNALAKKKFKFIGNLKTFRDSYILSKAI